MEDSFFETVNGEQPPTSDEKTNALLAHVLCFVGGFIAPLVIYLVNKDKSKFVRKHAAEALNYQLTFIIIYFLLMIVSFATMFGSIFSHRAPGAGFIAGFMGLWVLCMLLFVANLVFIILGTVKASSGQPFKYPVRIPFVK